LKVVAKDFEKDLLNILEIHSIKFEKKEFDFEDLKGIDIVVVAVDDISLQEKIYQYTRGKNILVNSVDSPDFCDFIFPAYVKKGDLVIGVSTSGKVPGLSGRIREKIEECLPEDIDRLLEEIYQIRTSLPKGKERQKKILNLIEKIL
ncbi:MAG: bifunctional precorrin-2 dehydrogenase/sirohydrochlorin ferrochelatase, partial [Aquificota bacterium]